MVVKRFLSDSQFSILFRVGFPFSVDRAYYSSVAKDADVTYSHVSCVLNEFVRFGLVVEDAVGRSKFVRLSSKGERVLSLYSEIDRLMNEEEINKEEVLEE